jgi:hypothetical protein
MAHGAVEARGAHVFSWHPRGHLIETSCCQVLPCFCAASCSRPFHVQRGLVCEGQGDRMLILEPFGSIGRPLSHTAFHRKGDNRFKWHGAAWRSGSARGPYSWYSEVTRSKRVAAIFFIYFCTTSHSQLFCIHRKLVGVTTY